MSLALQPAPSAAIDEQNPWPGLASFDESAEQFFKGRRRESAELARLVMSSHLTVLFGASGMGKTSLMQAGLFPLLRRARVLPVYLRLGVTDRSRPLIEQARSVFERELQLQQVEAPAFRPGESLWEYLHRDQLELWSRQNQLLTPLLAFDQFEEVLTLGEANPEGVAQLRIDLGDLVENRLPSSMPGSAHDTLALDNRRYKVLLSFREDYLAGFEGWKRELPSIMRNRYGLTHMSGTQALEVVVGPGKNIISETVAQSVVRFVAATKEDERRDERPLAALQVEPALLSVVCRELNARRQRAGRDTITAKDVDAARGNILDDFYERSFQGLPPEARIFVEDQLLTPSGFRNTAPEEVAVGAGLTQAIIAQLIERRLIRRERRLGVSHVELTHDLLTKVVRSSREARLRRAAQAAEEERRVLEERRKRAKTIRVIVSIAGILILILAGVAYYQMESAKNERRLAEAAQAVAYAIQLNSIDFGNPSGAFYVRVSDGNFRLWNKGTGQWIDLVHEGEPVTGAAFSPDGQTIVTTSERIVRLWDVTSGKIAVELRGHNGPIYTAAFSPDRKLLVTCSYDQTARVWDIATGKQISQPIEGDPPLRSAAFSPDGEFVLIVGKSGVAKKWEFRTNRPAS